METGRLTNALPVLPVHIGDFSELEAKTDTSAGLENWKWVLRGVDPGILENVNAVVN